MNGIRTRPQPRRGWTNAQDSGTVGRLMAAVNAYASTQNLPAAAGMGAFTAATLIDQPRAH